MRFWKWTIGMMIAVPVVGCATYPVGYWVNPRGDDLRFENELLYCNQEAKKNADLIVPTADLKGGSSDPISVVIYLIVLPGLIMNEQRWANVYTNTIKACREETGYRWVNNPKGEKIKAKSFAPSQIDESQ